MTSGGQEDSPKMEGHFKPLFISSSLNLADKNSNHITEARVKDKEIILPTMHQGQACREKTWNKVLIGYIYHLAK